MVTVLVLPGIVAAAQGEPISARALEPEVFGAVMEWKASPDGRLVAYRQSIGPDQYGLFVQDVHGAGSEIQLEGVLGPAFGRFAFASDGLTLVYVADLEGDGPRELLRAPLSGGPAQRLSAPLAPGLEVGPFRLGPAKECAYIVEAPSSQAALGDLFSISLDGTSPPHNLTSGLSARVTPVLELAPGSGRVVFSAGGLRSALLDGSEAPATFDRGGNFRVSPDGQWVVIGAVEGPGGALYVAPADASQPARKLSGTLETIERIDDIAITPDGLRVVFSTTIQFDVGRLYSSPLDGSTPAERLDTGVGADGVFQFVLDPAGTRVAYMRPGTAGPRLVIVPVDGGPVTGLDAPASLSQDPAGLQFTPDGTRLVFEAGLLHSVLADGSAPPLVLDPVREAQAPEVDPLGQSVGYMVGSFPSFELFLAPVDRAFAPQRVNGPQLGGGAASFLADRGRLFTPDGGTLLYRSTERFAATPELYSRGRDLAHPGRLASGAVRHRVSSDVTRFIQAPDGGLAVFSVAQAGQDELFAVGLSEPHALVALTSGFFPAGASVLSFALTPDGSHVLFTAQVAFDNGGPHLFGVPSDGSRPPTAFPEDSSDFGDVRFVMDPGGTRVVYRTGIALHSAPIAQGGNPVSTVLTSTLMFDPVSRFEITSDGQRVVFVGGTAAGGARRELYGVPIEGGAAPLQLSSFSYAPPAGAVGRIALAPDGQRVAYLADQLQAGRMELFTAPVDGSAASVRLSRVVPAGGDVSEFRFGPDGTRIVYQADSESDEFVELYGVLADGSTEPVKLSAPMPLSGDVTAFRLGAGRVVYRADAAQNDRFELFASTLDGGQRGVRLHPALAPTRDVEEFETGGARVVYAADTLVDDAYELYSTRVTGVGPGIRGANTRLAPGLVLARDGQAPFVVSPDGGRVLLRALGGNGVELHLRDLLSGKPELVDASRVAPGGAGVTAYAWTADGTRALYIGDLREPGVFELFLAPLGGPTGAEVGVSPTRTR